MTTATQLTISERVVDVWDGTMKLRVKVAGSGTPLVYVHAAAGLAWDTFLNHLAEDHTVYAPEFPGTSAGDPYAIRAVDALSDVVLIYEELVRALGLDAPILVGHSFGGMLAAELAAAYPNLVSALVLLSPFGLWRADAPTGNWITTSPEDLPALLFHDPQSPRAQAMLALPDDPDIARAVAAGQVWAFGCTGKFGWPVPDHGLRNRLHRITAPTLVVWGRDDTMVSIVYAEEWAKLISDSQLTIIDDCGHIPQVEKRDETTAAVDAFLAQL